MRHRSGLEMSLLFTLACSSAPPQQLARDSLIVSPPAHEFAFRSPSARDTLVEGRSYLIRWVAVPAKRLNLGVAMGGKDKGFLLVGAPAGLDSLRWTVPIGFVTGFGPTSSDQVRLRLENADDPNDWVDSDRFVIIGAPPK
ncbi:MAG: hypothetical protein ABIZ70_03870 [Gemmatimonadales bacterium]